MKILNPSVTVIVPSHMKPPYLPGSLATVTQQTRRDIQVIVVDSGEWIEGWQPGDIRMESIYKEWSAHPLVEWYSLGEPPALIERKCPISYVANEVIRAGLIRGRYTCVFTDDDMYDPTYVEKMAGFLDLGTHRAVYCAQKRLRVHADGTFNDEPGIAADVPRHGAGFDQQIDMLQMMFQTSVLGEMDDPWFDENPETSVCRHSDGMFMDRVGEIVGEVANIPEALVTHRYTPISTYN